MSDIFKHPGLISNSQRASLLGQRGVVVWLTGLSGSGKSTLAYLAEKTLLEKGKFACVLDGDNLRHGLNKDLGFSAEDRAENIRRLSHVATLLASSGVITIVSAISPFTADREEARKVSFDAGHAFVEVFVDTPVEECARRDPKGLYKKAMAGEIDNFTGISSPYEPPENPELILNCGDLSPEAAANALVDYMEMLATLEDMTRFAADLAVKAGEEIMKIYNGDFSVEYKDDSSPLTAADLAANTLICRELKRAYPRFAILSEESSDDKARLLNPGCFIVDPLDGTKEFVKRNGEFTVNIAFSYFGKAVIGVVFAPVTRSVWYAAKGSGAYHRQGDGGKVYFAPEERIFVSSKTRELTVAASRSHSGAEHNSLLEKNKSKIADVIQIGSSLKGCLIAQGKAEVYYRTGYTNEWDTAAMQCIVEQAGGVFLQGDGTFMRYNRENPLNEKGFFILNRIENRFDLPDSEEIT